MEHRPVQNAYEHLRRPTTLALVDESQRLLYVRCSGASVSGVNYIPSTVGSSWTEAEMVSDETFPGSVPALQKEG